MIQILMIILIVLNMYGIILKKNNIFIVLFSSMIIYLIMGLNSYTSDYPFYESYYNSQIFSDDFEMGFVLLSEFIYWMGFDYQGFLLMYFAVCLSVIALAVKGMDVNIHVILLLYLLTQMFMDINEIRQTMAYFMFAFILSDFAKNNSKIRYVIYVVIASFFHRSIFLFLPAVFFIGKTTNSENLLKLYFALISACCVAVFMNGNKIPGLNLVLIALGFDAKAAYFETNTQFGFILMWMAYFSNLYIIYLARKKIKKYRGRCCEIMQNYINNLWKVLLYSAFAMPLCMLNSEFIRYYQFTVIPVILVIAMMMVSENNSCTVKQNMLKVVPFNLCVYFYLAAYSLTYQHWRVVEEVIENNLLNDLL